MLKTSKICKIHVFIVFVQDCLNRTLRRCEVASKVNPTQLRCTPGPGTKEALSEEMAPWNPSIERDPPLPQDNRTLHPPGSLYVVNKLHALQVKDVKDCKNTCIVVICTNVVDVEDCKNTCIVVICTNVKDVEDSKILVFNPG